MSCVGGGGGRGGGGGDAVPRWMGGKDGKRRSEAVMLGWGVSPSTIQVKPVLAFCRKPRRSPLPTPPLFPYLSAVSGVECNNERQVGRKRIQEIGWG